jgi:hypothetical protein
MTQVVEHLPGKNKALSINPSTANKTKQIKTKQKKHQPLSPPALRSLAEDAHPSDQSQLEPEGKKGLEM